MILTVPYNPNHSNMFEKYLVEEINYASYFLNKLYSPTGPKLDLFTPLLNICPQITTELKL